MNTQRSLPILLVSILLSGCAFLEPHTGPKALVGTWTNSLGTVWMIHGDGTFDVDLNKDGKRDAWGKYSVAGDTMTIFTTGGVAPKVARGMASIISTGPQMRSTSRSSRTPASCASKTC